MADLSFNGSLEQMDRDADMLRSSIHQHLLRRFAPNAKKTLRSFTSAEVSRWLGLSQTHLRKLHSDGKIPDVRSDESGRKAYMAEDIIAIREALAESAKNPLQFLPRRREGEQIQILSTVSFKGGSGKTTSAVSLSHGLALRGYRVLVIDLDPQASLSSMFGLHTEIEMSASGTVYDALRYENALPMASVVRQTFFPGIDIAPGGLILSEFETETPLAIRRNVKPPFFQRLHKKIMEVEAEYDVVVIDCPPQLGFITMSALVASTGLIVPIIPNFLDAASLVQFLTMMSSLLRTIAEMNGRHDYAFMKYLLARYEPQDGPQQQVSGLLRANFGSRVMTNPFLKSTAIADAGLTHQSLFEIERSSIHRNTYDRAIESIESVCGEIEEMMLSSWGRI